MSAAATDVDSAAHEHQQGVESSEGDDAARAAEDARAVAEAVAAAERRRRVVRHWCAGLGDAEQVCAQLLEDAVDDMFAEMQVLEENQRGFALVARAATQQVFAGLAMGGIRPNESLDRVVGAKSDARRAQSRSAGVMQQVLKPDVHHSDDDAVVSSPTKRSHLPQQQSERAALASFLRSLCASLESQPSASASVFLAFPATSFVSTPHLQPHHPTRSHPHAEGSKLGSWAIPASELSAFLSHYIVATNACVLPSTVAFVVATNRATLERKQKTLSLAQVQICVQKALFAAEEAVAAEVQDALPTPKRPGLVESREDDYLPRACYMDEGDPMPTPIDRNAPGSLLAKKGAGAAAKQGLARRVILALRPGPSESSKWLSLRSRVVTKSDTVTEVAIQADVSVSVTSDAKVGLKQHQPKKLSLVALATDVAKTATTSSSTGGSSPDKKYKKPLGVEPDAAALSNIFSLGTPRQMNTEELARRNDILALLEREAQRNERRMANASIAAMAMPVSTNLSETDKSYQTYVATNSSITVPLQAVVPEGSRTSAAATGALEAHASPVPLSPTRPPGNVRSPTNQHHSRELTLRTKFDLEREPPAFVISEGNAHIRDELSAFEVALSSPIKRSKGRATRATSSANRAAPASPIRVAEPNGEADPSRPVQTASSHLPQLETSRLAVGVCAVVRGVEKRGPKRSPSRKSRLKLHNYNTIDGDDPLAEDQDEREAPQSPIKRPHAAAATPSHHYPQQQPAPPIDSEGGSFLPLIPPVSPIQASPHRKHVRFHGNSRQYAKEAAESKSEDSVARAGESPLAAAGRRSLPAKQPVWDQNTASPPRVRNRFFAASGTTRVRAHCAGGDADDVADEDLNLFKTQLEAPRRSHLPATSYGDDL